MTFIVSGPGRVYCKHSTAAKDDNLLESMKENNWHEFLNGSILSTSGGICGRENLWLKNTTGNLEWRIDHYKYAFDEMAHLYHRLLERGPIENMNRLFRHLNICTKNMKETMEKLGYIKLYFRCVDKFIETGKTPLSNSGRALSKINPPGHLHKDIRLPVFSQLYHKYREPSASFMLSAFFMGHLFNEIHNGGLERDEVTVPMLEEMLVNCSARALKSNPKDFEVMFQAVEFFKETFLDMLMEKQRSYQVRSNNESLEADAVIRSQFQKNAGKSNQLWLL